MKKDRKGHIALVVFAVLAVVGVFTKTEFYPDPPTKGICTFCGAVQHAMNP